MNEKIILQGENLLIAARQKVKEREYWLKKLSGEWVKNHFLYDKKANGNEKQVRTLPVKLGAETCSKLKALSKGSPHTLHMILVAALELLIYKYTGQPAIIIGTPLYRQKTAAEILNTVLVLKNQVQNHLTFKELLLQVRQTITEATENYSYPVELLLKDLNIPFRREDDFPLFDIALQVENIHDKTYLQRINLNMFFTFKITGDDLEGRVEYNALRYEPATVERIISHFTHLLREILRDIDVRLSTLTLLSTPEKEQILLEFNKTGSQYPDHQTIQQLFSEQVERTPDKIAVVGAGNLQVTYRQLHERSRQIAAALVGRGIGKDVVAGIMMDHSLEMVTGVLGILIAGAAYLPIEPELPDNRVLSMLEDTRAPILLTKTSVLKSHSFGTLQALRTAAEQVLVTPQRPQIKDFDAIGIPDRSLVNYEKYSRFIGITMFKNSITVQATRGCPYKCAYCHKIWPKSHVVRSAENLLEEVQALYNMGVRRFSFADDIFNLDVKNSTRFYRLLLKKGMKIQICFSNGLRGDILTKDYIDLLIEAGAVDIALALETASPRLQKLLGKNINIEKLKENVQYICEKYPHIILELQTMHGFPTETPEEAIMTLDFIKNTKWIHFPYIHVLKIYPNTDMAKLALKNGVSRKAIENSLDLAFHELPETLPFNKSLTLKIQSEYFNQYILSKERLRHLLPYQFKLMTPDEMIQKYNNFFPVPVTSLDDFFRFVGISEEELGIDRYLDEDTMWAPDLNHKMQLHFSSGKSNESALNIMLLDLSQYLAQEKKSHSESQRLFYETVEAPLGMMYLLTALQKAFGSRIKGKIHKSGVEFDSYAQLKTLVEEFKPDIIGIRTLSFYRNYFHTVVSMIRHWGIDVPIVTGGPYATSEYKTILQDRNVDLVVLGEGEETFTELVGKIMENDGKLPDEAVLAGIAGIAFVPDKGKSRHVQARKIFMLDEMENLLTREPGDNPGITNNPSSSDLAYVIFTSGSSGKPKGVMVEHRSLMNLCSWHNRYFQVEATDRATKYAGFGFDASVWEIFPYLVKGASLYIISDELKLNITKLNEYYEKNGITISFLPTQFCELFMTLENHSLKKLLTGGDKLNTFEKRTYQLYNNYGPTENTVVATSCLIDKYSDNIPIGKPIDNNAIYITDIDHLRLQPVGIAGELCISGASLARGYLNNPDLTRLKFIPEPFASDRRMFKTGDRARWREDGNIQFLGRGDEQVKIRGYRIEPGEIEALLRTYKNMKEAVVVPVENQGGEQYLCAYMVAKDPLNPASTDELKTYLAKHLPHYMIPSYFTSLDRMPLNTSGKVDRRALPTPQLHDKVGEYVEPGSEIEKLMKELWQEVLGMERIGIYDNFFDLGGDSIKTIQVSTKLQKHGLILDINDFFANPTIKKLSPHVKSTIRAIHQGKVTGEVELTPIQTWFFQKNFQERHHFNHYVTYYSQEPLEEEIIKKVFTRIGEHHDALRIVYEIKEGKVVQRIRDLDEGELLHLEVIDLREEEQFDREFDAASTRIQRGINLETGPLVKLGLFHTRKGDILLVVIHHAVVDGVSWRILFEDFRTGYLQAVAGEEIKFQEKTDSFQYWAEKLTRYASSEKLLKQLDYWKITENTKPGPLPVNRPVEPGSRKYKNRETVTIQLDKENTENLLRKVNWAYNTQINDILLTALGMAIRDWSRDERVLISLEGHGRESIMEDVNVNRTVGWFTSQFPVLLHMKKPIPTGTSSDEELEQQIKQVKETLNRVPDRGIGFGILKHLTPPEKKQGLEFKIQPQIQFNYLGQ